MCLLHVFETTNMEILGDFSLRKSETTWNLSLEPVDSITQNRDLPAKNVDVNDFSIQSWRSTTKDVFINHQKVGSYRQTGV